MNIETTNAMPQMIPRFSHGTAKGIPLVSRNEARLEQEAQCDHPALIPDRPQHPDLLPPLDNRPRSDYGESGDPDDQAQSHETLEDEHESVLDLLLVVEQLVDRIG